MKLILSIILLFICIDELTFVLYNISIFQMVCTNMQFSIFSDELAYVLFNDVAYVTLLKTATRINIETGTQILNDLLNIMNMSISPIASHKELQHIHSDIVEYEVAHIQQYYKIQFESTNIIRDRISFYPLLKYIFTIPGEASLVFFRMENHINDIISVNSVYSITPNEAISFITKLQCFCYEELLVSPYSIVDLPILFCVNHNIRHSNIENITINYILIHRQ